MGAARVKEIYPVEAGISKPGDGEMVCRPHSGLSAVQAPPLACEAAFHPRFTFVRAVIHGPRRDTLHLGLLHDRGQR